MRTLLLTVVTTAFVTGCLAQIDDAPAPAQPIAPHAIDPADPYSAPPTVDPETTPAPVETPPPAEEPVVLPPPNPPGLTGTLSLSVPTTSVTLHLNESKEVKVTVTPSNGFNGNATFAVTGLPAGISAVFTPSFATLSTAPVEVTMTLRSMSNLIGKTGMPLTITTSAGTISSSTPLTLDLVQEVFVTIAKGVALGTAAAPNKNAFGAVSIPVMFVAPGTKVTFVNLDTRAHEIHANNNPTGLNHEPGPLVPNGSYSQILKAGTVNFRCHIHPNMLGQIVVQ
jgi:plastocyanin